MSLFSKLLTLLGGSPVETPQPMGGVFRAKPKAAPVQPTLVEVLTPLTIADYSAINHEIQNRPRAVSQPSLVVSGECHQSSGPIAVSGVVRRQYGQIEPITGGVTYRLAQSGWYVASSGEQLGYDASTGNFFNPSGSLLSPAILATFTEAQRNELYQFFGIINPPNPFHR